ncbi:hypothetical protein ACU8KH_06097 [Lachancea thermotolerans]
MDFTTKPLALFVGMVSVSKHGVLDYTVEADLDLLLAIYRTVLDGQKASRCKFGT